MVGGPTIDWAMDFYPPHELPPMQTDAPREPAPRLVTRQRIAMFVGVFALLGLLLAMALYWAFGNIALAAIFPGAVASGWYFGANPMKLKLRGSARDAGPVLW